ncbi:asparagine synthase C-terminal domain-containing protein, partial [Pelagibacteraceae bacterium]|nr:asparagine synthase C-terminal domain-containing protein [Pelagibacteraceae bacterium]
LIKSDKSSMYFGLENRSPYLNKDIIEFSNTIPIDFKIKKNKGKLILRSLLNDYIPNKFFERPKQGFAIPLGKMLKSNLYYWAEDLLNYETVDSINVIRNDVKNIITKTKTLSIIDEKRIWNLLMFQSWYKTHIK